MQANIQREALLERREQNSDVTSTLWARLSLAQKFAASSLSQFGYDLAYIRHSHHGNIAILQCNGNTATISIEGEIDTAANIKMRS
ncbi:hypothetical protein [Colwellia sp. E150_009]|tara:strand:- start:963 stop:1220 length:258 start_codon:yes stop_codon:yes gene_type:complete